MKMTSTTQIHPLFAFGAAAAAAANASSSSSGATGIPNSNLSVTLTPFTSSSSGGAGSQVNVKSEEDVNMKDEDSTNDPGSPPPSPNSPSPCPSPALTQQQIFGRLASGLSSAVANANSHSSAASVVAAAAAASKLMELTPIDDLVMSEVTQRLFKMNQELWQQGVVANAAAQVQAQAAQVAQAAAGQSAQNQQQQQLQAANEIKLAEKLVNELAVQQSTRNAFHLNERTLQECWNTLQRVSCMIFMHKSAMQLQQQQQAAAQQAQSQQHQLMRAGSSSGSESGALSKPHQCQSCLKSFSSNHQLVQHIRVHTGEKPYKCSYCDRRFKQLSHVQQHTRLHTGERPYKCHVPECGRAFIQLSNLQQHLRNHDAQLERSKNRPFHCNICGKGFATESSLRTHTTKVCKDQHAALIGGPNAVTCPICHKLFLGGEALMEHMKHTHKDPNASGVATKRRTANHPCPVCGKHYVNEGSLRKHLTCHPETAQLTSSLRMYPCTVCQAVFTHETGLLTHMEQMRMDPKHQFAAQWMLSRAAADRRERESILAAVAVSAMAQAGSHPFGSSQGQGHPSSSLGSLLPIMPPSPSGSESSGRLSSPLDSGISQHSSVLQHTRMSMSSPINAPIDARVHPNNSESLNGNGHSNITSLSRKDYENLVENNNSRENHLASHHLSHAHSHHLLSGGGSSENGGSMLNSPKIQEAMKMAGLLGQGHGPHSSHLHGQSHSSSGSDLRNLIHHHASQGHGQSHEMLQADMRIQAEALLRSQAAEAFRLAVANNTNSSNQSNRNSNNNGSNSSGSPPNNVGSNNGNGIGNSGDHSTSINHLNSMLSQQQQQQQHHHHELLRGNSVEIRMSSSSGNGMQNGRSSGMDVQGSHQNGHLLHHHHHNHHQLNSILSQQSDLSEALLRLDARSLGFPLSAHNS